MQDIRVNLTLNPNPFPFQARKGTSVRSRKCATGQAWMHGDCKRFSLPQAVRAGGPGSDPALLPVGQLGGLVPPPAADLQLPRLPAGHQPGKVRV